MIKLMATDMDGTFLDANGQYSREELEELLQACEEKGVLFTVASGRALLALEELFQGFSDRIAIIAENGGLVQFKGETLFEAKMTPSDYLPLAETLLGFPDCQGMLLSGHDGAYAPMEADEAYLDHMKRYYANVQRQDWQEVKDTIYKVTVKFTPDTVRRREEWLTQNLSGMKAVTTGFDSIDIILSEVDKGFGLRHLCQVLEIDLQDTLAFGDNLNDYEMLSVCGKGIAVANAREEVKAIADEIIGSCEDNAVMNYMKNVVIQNA